jgi:hemolysin D
MIDGWRQALQQKWQRLSGVNWQAPQNHPTEDGDITAAFGSPIDRIIDEEPSHFTVRAAAMVAVMFVTLITIGALVEIDVVISGAGEIVLEGAPDTVQAMERGIVREVRVKPGMKVARGDIVITLDPTFAQADLKSLQARQQYLQSMTRRLSAEAAGVAFVTNSGTEQELLQELIFKERTNQRTERLKAFDEEIKSLGTSALSQKSHKQNLTQQLAIATEVEKMRQGLYETKVGSRLMLLESQSLRLRTEKEVEDASNKAVQLQHARAARESERQGFIDEWRRTTLEDLARAKDELSRINEEIDKSQRRNSLVELVATSDGIVTEVASVSKGSIIRDAETLVTVMPTHRKLIAEVYIKASDAGRARAGDAVTIKVDAFPYQRFGKLTGKLTWISEANYFPQAGAERGGLQPANRARLGGAALHRARIEIDEISSAQATQPMAIVPGMTITADVKLKTRSVIGLLFEPLQRGMQESLKEP